MKKLLIIIPALISLGLGLSVEAAKELQPIIKDDFDTYINGSMVNQGGWINYANGENFIIQDIISFKGKKALYNNSLGDSVVTKTGASLSDGKQVLYIKTENRSNWGAYSDGNAQVRISKGQSFTSNIFIGISFKQDGNVAFYNPTTGVYQNFSTYNDNEWTKLTIQWRSGDKTARYRINKNTWTEWNVFEGSISFIDFDNVGFDFYLPSGSGGVYIDRLR